MIPAIYREVIKLKHEYPDHIYIKPTTIPSRCSYTRGNSPDGIHHGCILGVAMQRLEIKIPPTQDTNPIYYLFDELFDEEYRNKHPNLVHKLREMQTAQDQGTPWGQL